MNIFKYVDPKHKSVPIVESMLKTLSYVSISLKACATSSLTQKKNKLKKKAQKSCKGIKINIYNKFKKMVPLSKYIFLF